MEPQLSLLSVASDCSVQHSESLDREGSSSDLSELGFEEELTISDAIKYIDDLQITASNDVVYPEVDSVLDNLEEILSVCHYTLLACCDQPFSISSDAWSAGKSVCRCLAFFESRTKSTYTILYNPI